MARTGHQELALHMNFSKESSGLVIYVNRVTGLSRRKDGKPHNTYVKLFLVPKIAEQLPRKVKNTEIKRETDEPVFGEPVKFEMMTTPELVNSVIHVELLEYSGLQKDQVLGEADLPLSQVQFVQNEASTTLLLDIPSARESNGSILISIAYIQDIHELNVWLIKCKDLNKGNNSKTDAQAKVWLTRNGMPLLEERYTKTVSSSASPCFHDKKFSWTVDPLLLGNIAIHVAVVNQHPTCKRKLGHVTICKQQASWTRRMHWATFINTKNTYIKEWHELVQINPTKKEEDKPKVSLAQLSVQLEYNTAKQSLTLTIQRAHWDLERGSMFSSFVRTYIMSKLPEMHPRVEERTRVVTAKDTATFNEEITYDDMTSKEFYNSILHLELVDQDFIGEVSVLGQKCLSLADVCCVHGKSKLNILLDPPIVRKCA